MIHVCNNCGGLFCDATDEMFAGKPCDCGNRQSGLVHKSVTHAISTQSSRIAELELANKNANAAIGDIANECAGYVKQLTLAQAQVADLYEALDFLNTECCKDIPEYEQPACVADALDKHKPTPKTQTLQPRGGGE